MSPSGLHHYSVPKEREANVSRLSMMDTLKYIMAGALVTTHQRDDTPYSYTTKDAHGPPGRHGSYERIWNRFTNGPARQITSWLLYLRKVAELKKHPPRRSVHAERHHGAGEDLRAETDRWQAQRHATESLYGYQEIRRIRTRG